MQLSIFDFAPCQLLADKKELLLDAAVRLQRRLLSRQSLDSQTLRTVLADSFGGSDADGLWDWKDAYEAVEVALVLWLKRRGQKLLLQDSQSVLAELQQVQSLCPTQSKRSQDSVRLQQFSTPLPLAYLASLAAHLRPSDTVLEPSAGTGLLAACCQLAGAKLLLNELCPNRAALLKRTFPGVPVFSYNAEQIDDYLHQKYRPTVVVMNPPFTASPKIVKRNPYATYKHLCSALARLPSGGRLVAITANWFSPLHPDWQELFAKLTRTASIAFSVGIAGKVYAKHGTNVETRLTVIDKVKQQPGYLIPETVEELAELLSLIERSVPPRCPTKEAGKREQWQELPLFKLTALPNSQPVQLQLQLIRPETEEEPTSGQRVEKSGTDWQPTIELDYQTRDRAGQGKESTGGLYETYQPQTVLIPGAAAHPTPLVQSAAMASVAPPKPSYRPQLPERLLSAGILSAAQLESLIYAGEAHSQFLSGYYLVDENLEQVSLAPQGGGVQFRRGWFLGDGTGCGKGRQVAGIILDNWLRGRRKALWVSKSDKLLEDARRDWQALGGSPEQVVPLSRFRQGEAIAISEGIIFLTYATLRTQERQGKQSRVQQLIDWCGADFEGAIVFDESHAMANAAAAMGSRGLQAPSQQGLAGLRLQNGLPQARVLYVSATGATTVHNLAYATRLGLWGSSEFPFASRSDFIGAMEKGGIAAMEVVCRDLKSLGLYCSRCLSYDGIHYEILEHELTPEQVRIYDSYAAAFQIIHQNIEAALEATNITSASGKCRNPQAKSAARSAFESNKQRFFNHLLTAMKCPTLIRAIERDLDAAHAVVVQIVSTNEALLDRRLAQIPTSEWGDLEIDITPREYVLDYLMHSFPVHLHEVYSDEKGNEYSRLATDGDGNPIICQSALAQRDRLIEKLALLPPIPGALDILVQHFGTENVAEVTGRSKRVIRQTVDGRDVLSIQKRPATANLDETQAFMDDRKPILIFSDAGGTGRSYHADLGVKNQRLRVHYLLEAGWKADTAIQGLGRSNRTNQKQPPVFRPLTTNVKGEKRFISTIARRLDSLGALTRGQRQTGGQGLFNEGDNFESLYARAALTDFYHSLYHNRIASCTLTEFEGFTGLSLSDREGGLKQELPPISQFLNRLLALPISLQNALFQQFELRLESRIEAAIASGTYEVGVEMLRAESFRVLEEKVIYTHPATGAPTTCCHIERRDRTDILSLAEASSLVESKSGCPLENRRSGRVAIAVPTDSRLSEDGGVIERVKLLRPTASEKVSRAQLAASTWQEISLERFQSLWQAEVSQAPEYTTKTFYLIAGLLLPIWNRLDSDNLRVWSLTADSGERLLGRLVEAESIQAVYQQFAIDAQVQLNPSEIVTAVLERRAVLPLNRWWLRSSRVMGQRRLELTHFQPGEVDWLKAAGCFSELISWQLRLFIPLNQAAAVIAKLTGFEF
jgi:hypothetical protein